jgi:hypothetical protein
MGKVGSTSVYISLRRLQLGVPLYHLHFLNNLEHKVELMQQQAGLDPELPIGWVEDARKIQREMTAQPDKRWNLISLTRLPVPRQVSAFFEGATNRFPDMAERYDRGELQLQEVMDYFVQVYRDETPLRWFQLQIEQPFGLDVYATPFDKARGYQIYSHKNIRLLLIRLENLNRVAPQAMREFLNIPNFRIVNRNAGESKKTGAVYRDMRANLRLPGSYIDEWHTTQYAQHFYTPQELQASVASWQREAR